MSSISAIKQQINAQFSGTKNRLEELQRKLTTEERYENGAAIFADGKLPKLKDLQTSAGKIQATLQSAQSVLKTMNKQADSIELLKSKANEFSNKALNLNTNAELIDAANSFLREVTSIVNTPDAKGAGFLFGDGGMPIKIDLTDNANTNINADGTISNNFFRGGVASVEFNNAQYQYADIKEQVAKIVAAANYAKGNYAIPGGVDQLADKKTKMKAAIDSANDGLNQSSKNVVEARDKLKEITSSTEKELKDTLENHDRLIELSEEELMVLSVQYAQIEGLFQRRLDLWLSELQHQNEFAKRLSQ
jgi:chemotaxis regulatin CheY-phosphate phosphatase CheZ